MLQVGGVTPQLLYKYLLFYWEYYFILRLS